MFDRLCALKAESIRSDDDEIAFRQGASSLKMVDKDHAMLAKPYEPKSDSLGIAAADRADISGSLATKSVAIAQDMLAISCEENCP